MQPPTTPAQALTPHIALTYDCLGVRYSSFQLLNEHGRAVAVSNFIGKAAQNRLNSPNLTALEILAFDDWCVAEQAKLAS